MFLFFVLAQLIYNFVINICCKKNLHDDLLNKDFFYINYRLFYSRDHVGGSEGAGPEVHPGDGQAHGHVQGQTPHPVDRSLRRH